MIEILGSDLQQAMTDLKIDARRTYNSTKKTAYRFEVWEMDEAAFDRLSDVSEEEWSDADYGWYRTGVRSGGPMRMYTVKGEPMKGYLPLDHAAADDEDGFPPDKYVDFMEYMDINQGLTALRNVSATAFALAAVNGLSLADFMKRYD